MWDRDGTQLQTITTPKPAKSVVFHPDGSIVTADDTGTITVWDIARRAPLRTVTAHRGAITALALTRTGGLVASGGADGTVRLWEPTGQSPVSALPVVHTAAVEAVAFSPDGTLLGTRVEARRPLAGEPAARET